MTKTTIDDVTKHILTDKFYDDVLMSYLSDKNERNEFRQELWVILLSKPKSTLIKWYDGKYLKYIYIGIINNQIKSGTSPWHRKFRMNKPMEYFDSYDNVIDDSELDITNSEIRDIRINYIESKLKELEQKDPYLFRDIQIFRMHFLDKLSYRKIEKKTGVSYLSVWKYVNNILFLIRKDIKEIGDDIHN